MPNHCSNRLTVTGPVADLERFAIQAVGNKPKGPLDDTEALDIFNFFPVPKELEGTQTGGCTIKGKYVNIWRKDANGNNIKITQKEIEDMKRKHGAACSYDWCIHRLGTKWGTYDSWLAHSGKNKLVYRYLTARGPLNEDTLKDLSELYPKLKFRMEFAERGSCYKGYAEAEDGDIIDKDQSDIGDDDFEYDDPKNPEDGSHYKHNDEYKDLVESSG